MSHRLRHQQPSRLYRDFSNHAFAAIEKLDAAVNNRLDRGVRVLVPSGPEGVELLTEEERFQPQHSSKHPGANVQRCCLPVHLLPVR